MTEDVKSPRSKPQSLKEESANMLLASVFCVVWFSLVAVAQEPTYSADSLMSAFEKGSQASLKGTNITFTGVIAESKKSRVTFKSSGNDKVICDLVSSTGKGNEELAVGRPLTVIGKVRGRGILGNVTLDECHLALSDGTKASSDVRSEEPIPEASPGRFEEPTEELLETQNVEATKPVAAAVPSKRPPSTGPIQATTPIATAAPQERPSSKKLEEPNKVIGESLNSPKAGFPDILRVFVAVLAGVALFAAVKLAPALLAIGSRTSPSSPRTQETRRAALEALLSAKNKKK